MRIADMVLVGQAGIVTALDGGTGRTIWQKDLGAIEGCSGCRGQEVAIHLFRAHALLAACAGNLFCLDASSGNVKWHRDLRSRGNGGTSIAALLK